MTSGVTKADRSGLPPRSSRAKPVRKGMHPIFKVILTLGIMLLVGSGVYLGSLWMKIDQTLGNISGDEPETVIPKEERAKQKPMVVLLLGLDTREATRSLNTDVIMVAALHPRTKQATIVSIPRDLYMKPEGYKAQKANAFYSISRKYGEGKPGGPDGLIKSMFGELLEVPIDYVTVINFKTFEDIIDKLGGIEVNVDMNMCYIDDADGTNIRLTKGLQTLNGYDALGFVRYRHSTSKCGDARTAESSDLERNQRQQQVLAAIVDRMTTLGGLLKLNDVLDAVGENIKSDIPERQLKDFLTTYATIKREDIEFIALSGQWKSPYIRVSDEVMDEARLKLKNRLLGITEEEPGSDETS